MIINIIAVDDEINILNDMKRILGRISGTQVEGGFTSSLEALKFVNKKPIDVAVLDIDMPELNGIELAGMLRNIYPEVQIIFATGYDRYALAAHHLDALGYLLKPYTFQEVEKAVNRARFLIEGMRGRPDTGVEVRCFGTFDIMIEGRPMFFKYNKAKELFALLVDARGGMISMEQAITFLWEEREYDKRVKALYRKAVSVMRSTFKEAGCEDICIYYRSHLAANVERFQCDYYDFLKGNSNYKRNFADNYMPEYSWAEETNANLKKFF